MKINNFSKQKLKRNVHANHPIMKKGGVHQKSNKAIRANDRVMLKKNIGDYNENG